MNSPPHAETIVEISADVEWQAIGRICDGVQYKRSPFGEWFVSRIAQELPPVLFFHGGWGKIAAAASTQYFIDRCAPSRLINLGTCGGFAGEIDRGTVVLVERTVVYDIYEQMGDHAEHIEHYTTEIDLSWLKKPYPHDVTRTLIVSADRDLVASEIPLLKRQFGAVVADWESGSIAWVAQRNGLRTLILRGVSDLVGADGGEAYDGQIRVFAENALNILRQLVDQLPDWLRVA